MQSGEGTEAGPRGRGVLEGRGSQSTRLVVGRGLQQLVGRANGGPALTKTLFVNGAHGVGATGRVLCATPALDLSQEAASYRSLLCLIELF